MENAIRIMDSEISIKEYKGERESPSGTSTRCITGPRGRLGVILEPTKSILLRVWISIKSVPTKFGATTFLVFLISATKM